MEHGALYAAGVTDGITACSTVPLGGGAGVRCLPVQQVAVPTHCQRAAPPGGGVPNEAWDGTMSDLSALYPFQVGTPAYVHVPQWDTTRISGRHRASWRCGRGRARWYY
jgi:hypothetical protein